MPINGIAVSYGSSILRSLRCPYFFQNVRTSQYFYQVGSEGAVFPTFNPILSFVLGDVCQYHWCEMIYQCCCDFYFPADEYEEHFHTLSRLPACLLRKFLFISSLHF